MYIYDDIYKSHTTFLSSTSDDASNFYTSIRNFLDNYSELYGSFRQWIEKKLTQAYFSHASEEKET